MKRRTLPAAMEPGVVVALTAADSGIGRYAIEVRATADPAHAAAIAHYTVSAELIADFSLASGAVVAERTAPLLLSRIRELALFDRGVSLLAVRGMSLRDLGLRLRRIGGTSDEVAHAVERLAGLGLADDKGFARHVATTRGAVGISRARIAQELRRKGVGSTLADTAAREATHGGEQLEYATALRLVQKRLRGVARLDPPAARRRLSAFLMRRGYSASLVARVVKEALASSRT